MNPDVVVVGAGIVGAACAAACSARGLRVEVLEQAGVGGGATAAGMGHLVVMDDSEAQLALTHYSRTLWQALAPELAPEVEYTASGTIWVAADADEMDEAGRKQRYYAAHGVAAELLSAAALAEHEPRLRPGLAGGLLVPQDAVIYPPCGARWLLERAQRAGATVRLGARVKAMRGGTEGCVVELADGSRRSAGAAVCAAGAEAAGLFAGLPIRWRKGHLVITDRYPGFLRHQLVELGYVKSAHAHDGDSVAFNAQPRATGQILIGSSRQFDDHHPAVDHGMLSRMLRRASEFMPALAELDALRVWTGFRAATPDGLPLIGPWPGAETVWLATGHEGLGITTALATGALVADGLTGTPPAIAPEPYLPGRWSGREEARDAHHG